METRFHYDLADKQLRFHVRQHVTTSNSLEVKATGLLDPSAGALSSYRAAVRQHFTHWPALRDSGGTPLRLGLGVALVPKSGGASGGTLRPASSSGGVPPARPVITFSADKKLALFDGPNTVLTLKAAADIDPAARNVSSRIGLAKLSFKAKGFTRKQDLKLSAGLTVDWPAGKRDPKPYLYLQARENNWAATLKNGRTYITYDL